MGDEIQVKSVSDKELKKGDNAAMGWIAEQTSCKKSGNVSSSVLAPPPRRSDRPSTQTESPARPSSPAALSPFGPPPTTTASNFVFIVYWHFYHFYPMLPKH